MPDAEPDPLEWFDHFAGDAPRCPDYVGLTRLAAEERARAAGRSIAMRVLDLDEQRDHDRPVRAWTADLRPSRLNLVVRGGIVIAAASF